MNRTARQLLADLCSLLWSAALLTIVCTALGLMGWRVHWAFLAAGQPHAATAAMFAVLLMICGVITAWCVIQVRRYTGRRRLGQLHLGEAPEDDWPVVDGQEYLVVRDETRARVVSL